jgi:hypothetical protein
MCDVDAELEANIHYVERTENVGPHGFDFVILAPVGIVETAYSGTVDDSGGFVSYEFTASQISMLYGQAVIPQVANLRTSSRLSILAFDLDIETITQ